VVRVHPGAPQTARIFAGDLWIEQDDDSGNTEVNLPGPLAGQDVGEERTARRLENEEQSNATQEQESLLQ
jgi:hypothetical protein